MAIRSTVVRNRRTRALCVLAVAAIVTGLASAAARADETTIGYSPLRTSWDAAEPGLTADTVTQPDFGQLWSTSLGSSASAPNQIYAQPVVAGGLVVVVTEENEVAALDPKTGAVAWTRLLPAPWTPTPVCGDLSPHVGITSTPVYDPVSRTIYLVSKQAGATAGSAVMRMYALAVDTGHDRTGWPLTIAGRSTDGGQAFNAATANQRPGLLLADGAVYFGTASHCDHGPYVGYVGRVAVGTAATPTTQPTVSLWSSESGSSADEAGIWQSGGGLMSDGDDAAGQPRVFAVTGNGVSPVEGPGTHPPGTLGESVVRLAVGPTGTMTAQDFFSPQDNDKLDQDDADLGSGGPVALPDSFGSTGHPHLMVTAGKDGTVWLLDRDHLGGMGQGTSGNDVVSSATLKGVWGRAAAFDGGSDSTHLIYLLPSTSPLQALRVTPDAHGVPSLSVVAASAASFGYTSGSPVVTSDGGDASSALVWVAVCTGSNGANGTLEAFPAVPPASGAWQPVVTYPLGSIAKFIQPATDGGRVFIATRDGRVLAFGRPTTAAVTAPSTDFGPVAADASPPASAEHDVVLTANAPVTINSVSVATGPFSLGTPDPAVGSPLAAGQTMTVPVTFAPDAAGAATASLVVNATPDGGAATDYPFALRGTGTAPGLAISPASVDFGDVAVGSASRVGVTVQNTDTTPTVLHQLSITDLSHAGFSLVDPPTGDIPLGPLGSVTVTLRLAPTTTQPAGSPATASLTASTDDGHGATATLSGRGFVGAPHLGVSTSRINFGAIMPGTSATRVLTVTNTGTSTMTITKAASPSAPFDVAAPINEGQTVQPGDSLTVAITAAPLSAEPVHNSYSITADDGTGAHVVSLDANTAPRRGVLRGPLGCVTLRSNIVVVGTPIVSTDCTASGAQTYLFGASRSVQLGRSDSQWCLDVAHSAKKPGAAVVLGHCDGRVSQGWAPDRSGRLVNLASRLCLDVTRSSPQPNTPLLIEPCSAAASEQWDPSLLVTAFGEISSGVGAANQYCLTDTAGQALPGTPLDLDACRADPGQLIAHVGPTLRVSGECVTLPRPVVGAGILLQPCASAVGQLWSPTRTGNLVNPGSSLCIADPASTRRTGTHLIAARCTAAAGLRWTLPG